MREKIAWITDSTGFLDEELKKNPDVYVVPMVVIINGREYEDGVDLSPDQLFRYMREDKVIPTTSQPSVGTFAELFRKLEPHYDRIVSVHVSSSLSGTVASSRQAAELVSIPVHIFDSLLISFPMTLLLKKIMRDLESGYPIEEAFIRAARYRDSNETYVLIGSLEQLHRSGRLSGTQYLLGSVLNVKPIISLEKGALATKTKARSERKAGQVILKFFLESCKKGKVTDCTILYGSSPEQTESFREAILAENPDVIIHIYPLGTAIGVHAGEKTVGLSWFQDP
ncbi:DegV family protein [Peribacillus glennii]|uniref:DegV family protein n=1 Tax=Peribacillus glennii TaxID=2303991 RepID=A0A372LGP1_9BACI|nr:DegV family protein [Peribacillus glennii]RFU65465.1 DegV family protein [Peribacillus glennii]